MQVTLSVIKHLIRTGAAVDITNADGITRRPYNSTIVFYSTGINGLNGIVLRNDETASFTPSPAVLAICLSWPRKGGNKMLFYIAAPLAIFAAAAVFGDLIYHYFIW